MNERFMFRGKHVDGYWIQGGLIMVDEDYYTITPNEGRGAGWAQPVDKSTVSQCTGLRDKNGTLVFEGDVLQASYLQEPFAVEWREASWMLSSIVSIKVANMDLSRTKIIGNIHDNPELLEVSE